MKNQINKKFIFPAISLLVLPLAARAQEIFEKGFLDNLREECIKKGNCSLQDIETGFMYLTKYLLAALAIIALVYFIYGAINWMMSSGSPERVKKGSSIMVQAIIGLFIAFGSYLLVSFFINDVLNSENEVQQETRLEPPEQNIVYYKK